MRSFALTLFAGGLQAGALTLVLWQEGGVVCVLATDAESEAVIQLAYAKAVKV